MQRTRTRPTILIVEDYPDSRHILKLLLEELDYSVLTAATGKEALAIASENDIDVVLVDYGLPDMTGPIVIRSLRQLRDELRHVPIVMLTAFDGNHYRRLASEAGCDAYLVKPPDFDDLQSTLERVQHVETVGDFQKLPVGSTNVKVEPLSTSL